MPTNVGTAAREAYRQVASQMRNYVYNQLRGKCYRVNIELKGAYCISNPFGSAEQLQTIDDQDTLNEHDTLEKDDTLDQQGTLDKQGKSDEKADDKGLVRAKGLWPSGRYCYGAIRFNKNVCMP